MIKPSNLSSNNHPTGRGQKGEPTNRKGPSPEELEEIAERLAKLHDERERLADKLREQTAKANLLSSVVLRCQKSESVEAALKCTLVNICRHTGWPVGHIYTFSRKGRKWIPAGISRVADPGYARFLQTIEQMDTPPGTAMLDQALRTHKPAWIPDLREDGFFPAQVSTVAQPLIGAFALAVPVDHSTEAVLEFFSLARGEPDVGMVEVADQVSQDLRAMISRKQTETMVRNSAQRFRRLANQAPVPLVTFDNEGEMKHVNRAAAEFLGGSQRDWKGRNVRDILSRRNRPVFQRFLRWLATKPGRRHLMNRSFQGEVRQVNGTKVPVEYALAAWSDEGKDMYTAVLFDLRHRREVEAHAHQAQNHLRDLLLEVKLQEQHARQKVAHRLHEDLAQILACCQMHLDMLSGNTMTDRLETKLQSVSELVRQALGDVRSISYELSPPGLQQLGLRPALNWLARELKKQAGVEMEIHHAEQSDGLPEPVRLVLYELLADLIGRLVNKHGSRNIRFEMVRLNERLRISIESASTQPSGNAAPVSIPGQPATDGRRLFAEAEIERLTHLGGSMFVRRNKDGGPRICIEMPMTK